MDCSLGGYVAVVDDFVVAVGTAESGVVAACAVDVVVAGVAAAAGESD